MSKARRIGLGLIGTGIIGRTHLTGVASIKNAGLLDVDIVALCDIDSESLNTAASLFEVPTTYQDHNELINDDSVDVIYICTPTNRHADMVKAVTKAKKSVFCEKPLAHSAPQARELVAMTKDAGIIAGVGLVLRYDQFLLFAKKLVSQNDFGRPMLTHIRVDQRFPVDYIYHSQWRGNLAIAGGGALIEHSIHDIDLLHWLYGEIESVYAKVNFFSGREVEDHASLMMTHKDGAVSTLDSVWHWVDRPNERFIECFFEKGHISIRLESGVRYLDYHLQGESPVHITKELANPALLEELGLQGKNLSQEALETITSVGAERYAALSYAFLKAVQTNSEPSPDFLDAVRAHRIVDAAYESSNKGRSVDPL